LTLTRRLSLSPSPPHALRPPDRASNRTNFNTPPSNYVVDEEPLFFGEVIRLAPDFAVPENHRVTTPAPPLTPDALAVAILTATPASSSIVGRRLVFQ